MADLTRGKAKGDGTGAQEEGGNTNVAGWLSS